MTDYLNTCRSCKRTVKEIREEDGIDEVILIAGMCTKCFKEENPWLDDGTLNNKWRGYS